MAAIIIDGKARAKEVREEVRREVERLREERGLTPGLVVVMAGDDPASATYVRNKSKACEKAGIAARTIHLPAETSTEVVLDIIHRLNADDEVDGILVQLPLPPQVDKERVLAAVDPQKDVDGFHPINVGHLWGGEKGSRPCTPSGIMDLLAAYGIEPKGKEAVIVGRSTIVGKPMAAMLLEAHATVTFCHTRTRDLADVVGRAEILVASAGSPGIIRGEWVREGACVIDVGISRSEEGKLIGDVEFEVASERAAFITPVPGGVGPMTIAFLLKNTLAAARSRRGVKRG